MALKIRHVRQKLHHEAVKLDKCCSHDAPTDLALSRKTQDKHHMVHPRPENHWTGNQPLAESHFPTGIFAGTKITPEALVQTLKCKETPDTPKLGREGPDRALIGRQPAKKEKMNERREKWLKKISFIKQAQQEQAAKAHRQAMPVVGDLRPLVDALPDLCPFNGPTTATISTARRMSRKNKMPVKRPEPTDFSQMKQSQKRKLLETESSRFSDVIKTLCGKTNPLADIGEQLRKRMRQEEEHSPC
ncbi:ribosome biogenesis protein SLX9 homolog [Paralichthys olivaceus]|uniref:ribosome biogenesis protein SLX9 homolog n=1 Tax=Paralichthys olivaceus TaxID=8255 RepID=UPI00097D5310|nr:PREDICTED: protein FAM207A [Paralichthys olivaceus]